MVVSPTTVVIGIGIKTCKIGHAAIERPNNDAVMIAENPVLAPADTPTVDSTNDVTVVAPIPAPITVPIASTLLALFIQFLSVLSRFIILFKDINVPVVSKKSKYTNEKIPKYVIGDFQTSISANPNQPPLATSTKLPKSA
jgi:hypothetical protein